MASKLLTGFIAGIVVGILIAPDKGSETRRKISQRGRDIKDKFNEYADDLNEGYETLKDKASNMINRGKEKAQSFRDERGNMRGDGS